MKLKLVLILALVTELLSGQNSKFVNPMIGTGGHGHTFPGAVLPFGMVQLSPDTRRDGSWDGCSGYHYSDNRIYGFTHTHLSGTGCSDWGDILVMPTTGSPSIDPAVYSANFKHEHEKASAGYYEVKLDNQVKAQLTVTQRVGIHKYTFPSSGEGNIVLDLLHRDKTLDCTILMYDSVTVYGSRVSEAWAKKQSVFYAMRFSKPFKKKEIANNGKFMQKYGKFKIRPEQGVFIFDLAEDRSIMVKVALSPVSMENALANLNAEAAHWDFEKYRIAAQQAWDRQLAKIEVSETDADKRTVFYTALYHASIHPSLSMDVDGRYRGRDDKIHTADGFTNYSVYSLWDTYRALHPLFTIIEQQRTADFINSFLHQYKQSGRLPVWELSANETDCMIGFHSVSVIADALSKNIEGFDKKLAFEAARAAATYSGFSIPEFNRKGYLTVDDENESVSKTMEYAYDNWCVSQIAALTGHPAEAPAFTRLAYEYRNLFDPSTGFMRPRKNGGWLSPFFPNEINNHFTEGNSWHYSFYTPHDVNGLIAMHGGKEKLEKKLDELFTTNEKTRGREQADVTGLLGQYAQGNEPSHHMAYLFNFVDRPEKTFRWVNKICNEFYKNAPDGLIGNEDCGQMSAWYIMSSLGMYPLCPGNPRYILTIPQFSKATIHLESGAKWTILSDFKPGAVWTGIKTGERELQRTELMHQLIAGGGTITYNFNQAGKTLSAPSTPVQTVTRPRVPIVEAAGQVFRDRQSIGLGLAGDSAQIYFRVNGSPYQKYAAPFSIDSNAVLSFYSVRGNDSSAVETARFYKVRNNYDLRIVNPMNPQYAADGAQTLVDGIEPGKDWRKGNWLGIQGKDFEVITDMKEQTNIGTLSLFCLQDSRSWILYPSQVEFLVSSDGKKYTSAGIVDNPVKPDDVEVQTRAFLLKPATVLKGRYVKTIARQFGPLPDWHQGKGGQSFIFAGELDIRP